MTATFHEHFLRQQDDVWELVALTTGQRIDFSREILLPEQLLPRQSIPLWKLLPVTLKGHPLWRIFSRTMNSVPERKYINNRSCVTIRMREHGESLRLSWLSALPLYIMSLSYCKAHNILNFI